MGLDKLNQRSSADKLNQLTGAEARRIAVRAQWLTTPRPGDLGEVVQRLTLLHGEPTKAVARSAEVVLWSRLGSAYRLGDLSDALTDGSLVELDGVLRPAEDIALFRAEMAAWPTEDWQRPQQDWLEANDGARRDILEKLDATAERAEGVADQRAARGRAVLRRRTGGRGRRDRIPRDLAGPRGQFIPSTVSCTVTMSSTEHPSATRTACLIGTM